MKRFLAVQLLALAALFAAGANPPKAALDDMYDHVLPEELEEIVGQGAWMYEWPHGVIPLEPAGFELLSGPFDFSKGNKGKTKHNWHMPTIYKSNDAEIQISVRVLRYHSKKEMEGRPLAIAPMKYWQLPIRFQAFEFHGLKAAKGHLSHDAQEIPPKMKVIVTFRIADLLFIFESYDARSRDEIEKVIVALAELVYQRN